MDVPTPKEQLTLRYWKASLAWRNRGEWADGWSTGDFIDEIRMLCSSFGTLGHFADILLDDVIHDVEFSPLEQPGKLVQLYAPKIPGIPLDQLFGSATQTA